MKYGSLPKSVLLRITWLGLVLTPATSYYTNEPSPPSSSSSSSSEDLAPSNNDYNHFHTESDHFQSRIHSRDQHPRHHFPQEDVDFGTPSNREIIQEQHSHSHHHHHNQHKHSHSVSGTHQSHHHHNHHFHNIQQDHEPRVYSSTEDYNAYGENQQQQHDRPYYNNHMSTNKYGENRVGNCRLPDAWRGKWFQSGLPSPILIDTKYIEGKGTCYTSSGDKFLFVEKKTCYRCLVINVRHRNVLEYKESSYCEERESLENLCLQIPGDAQLYSLFRLDAQAIDCPFKGPFMFSYNRGYGVCKSPMSRVDVCTEPSKLLLKYQACPDVPRTESTTEELQCLAEWRDGAYHYLVGKLNYKLAASNEDRYRCFIYEKAKGHVIKIAESGDATCTGLSSPSEGARTLTFQKVSESGTKCKFPSWMVTHHWLTLDGKVTLRSSHKNTTMSIASEEEKREQYYGLNPNNNQFSSFHGAYAGAYTGGPFGNSPSVQDTTGKFLTEGARIQCQSRVDFGESHVALVAHHTVGCTSTTLCIHLYRRDTHVVELQLREMGSTHSEDGNCGRPDAISSNLPYVTLISSGENSGRCPYLGKYMTTTITQDGRLISTPSVQNGDPCPSQNHHQHHHHSTTSGVDSSATISLTNSHHQSSFHSLVVGCGHRATMDFHSKCLPHEPITSYECMGSWEENGVGFLIASPMSRSSSAAHRYCFSYSETDEGLQVLSSSDSCLRSGNTNLDGIWAFNLTVDGQCAEPVTAGSRSNMNRDPFNGHTVFLLIVAVLLHLSSVWMITSCAPGWMDHIHMRLILSAATVSLLVANKVAKILQELLVIFGLDGGVSLLSKISPFDQTLLSSLRNGRMFYFRRRRENLRMKGFSSVPKTKNISTSLDLDMCSQQSQSPRSLRDEDGDGVRESNLNRQYSLNFHLY